MNVDTDTQPDTDTNTQPDVDALFARYVQLGSKLCYKSADDSVASHLGLPINCKDAGVYRCGYAHEVRDARAIIMTREPTDKLQAIEWDPNGKYTNLSFVGYTGKKHDTYFTNTSRIVEWRPIVGRPRTYLATDLHGEQWYIYLH